jgi:hypothetical protein
VVVVVVVVVGGGVVSEVVVSEVSMAGIGSDPVSGPPHAVRVARRAVTISTRFMARASRTVN